MGNKEFSWNAIADIFIKIKKLVRKGAT